jgi:hypothetical protein
MDRAQSPALNRIIRIAGMPGTVRATLEDDFHHFRVVLRHDGAKVMCVKADSPRSPFSMCEMAGIRLREIMGMPLTEDMTAVFRLVDARDQCTHQIDLAALAVTAAARRVVRRDYHAIVYDKRVGMDRHAVLLRDGKPILDWCLEGYAIASPEPYVGRELGAGFTAWTRQTFDAEGAEAALVLRRAVFIAAGRGMAEELDRQQSAPVTGGCWVQQPERAPLATRNKGSTQDFSGRAYDLTRQDDEWLAASG